LLNSVKTMVTTLTRVKTINSQWTIVKWKKTWPTLK